MQRVLLNQKFLFKYFFSKKVFAQKVLIHWENCCKNVTIRGPLYTGIAILVMKIKVSKVFGSSYSMYCLSFP